MKTCCAQTAQTASCDMEATQNSNHQATHTTHVYTTHAPITTARKHAPTTPMNTSTAPAAKSQSSETHDRSTTRACGGTQGGPLQAAPPKTGPRITAPPAPACNSRGALFASRAPPAALVCPRPPWGVAPPPAGAPDTSGAPRARPRAARRVAVAIPLLPQLHPRRGPLHRPPRRHHGACVWTPCVPALQRCGD